MKNKLSIILICLYLLVDWVPKFGVIDNMGSQWFYLSAVNCMAVLFLIIFRDYFKDAFNTMFGSIITRILVLFFLMCGLSCFFAINKVEALVVYSRLATGVVAYLCIGTLVNFRPVDFIFKAVSILLFIQCFLLLLIFFVELGHQQDTDSLILSLVGTNGNKNVMAASLVIKLPFVFYCIWNNKGWIHYASFCLAVFLIMILNARTAYISMFMQLAFYGWLLLLRNKNMKQFFIPVILCIVFSQLILKQFNKDGHYGIVTDRLASIAVNNTPQSNDRIRMWVNASDYIIKHPFIGCGYGNWKLASIPYDKTYYDYFNYSKHAHNDFIQITAETGILTGLIFLMIFYSAFVGAVIKNEFFGFICLLALITYMIDAFFNFPHERPVMQVFLMMPLALIAGSFRSMTIYRFKTLAMIVCVLLTVSTTYVSWSAFRSMVVQRKTFYDFGNRSDLSWQEVNNKFPAIPNLTEGNVPIDVMKAWYLYKGGRYQDALHLIDKSKGVNPYSMVDVWVKASIFCTLDQVDSASFYARKGKLERPNNMLFQDLLDRCGLPVTKH